MRNSIMGLHEFAFVVAYFMVDLITISIVYYIEDVKCDNLPAAILLPVIHMIDLF